MTTENRAAIERRLNAARDEAEAALEAATEALQTAQYQAVALNMPIAGKLSDDVADARRRLSECEGALIAFAKLGDRDAVEAQQAARQARESQVEAAAAEYRQCALEMIAVFEELMIQGPGARARLALRHLASAVKGANANLLTDRGWLSSAAMSALSGADKEYVLSAELIRECLQIDGYGPARAKERVQTMCDELVSHIKAHPSDWPAVV